MGTRARHQALNAEWPAVVPPLSYEEAVRATKKLLRAELKIKPQEFKRTSGRRYTWRRHGVWYINPSRGWLDLVHVLSHYVFMRTHTRLRPHHWKHANVEARMIRTVLQRGWLDGKLKPSVKPEKTPVDRLERLKGRLVRWEAKKRRAENAIRKLTRSIRAIERCRAVASLDPTTASSTNSSSISPLNRCGETPGSSCTSSPA